ncbi:MAG TPA: DJ-1/PfpI family protein [Chitinophagaceae bacterium]|nr:DJ-1/PfpI family protein [Chitinophagaceae bacterium]
MNVAVLLFEDFETLDVFGPVEILGRLKQYYQVSFYSISGGLVNNNHGVSIQTKNTNDLKSGTDIFLIPGGYGTRKEVENILLLNKIIEISNSTKFVLSVCTGSALLAKAGLLDGKKATSNKKAFDWVMTQGENVNWIRKARWVKDGKFYTSAGVSAGMDMTLGFLNDLHGIEFARKVAFEIEYNWIENMEEDNFFQQ